MDKIKWDFSKDKLPIDTVSIIICNNCGWLACNTMALAAPDKNKRTQVDDACTNCGKLYKDTKSVVKKIERTKGKKNDR